MRRQIRLTLSLNSRSASVRRLLALLALTIFVSPLLISCGGEEAPAETKMVRKKKKRKKPDREDMLAADNMTLGEAVRKYMPPERLNAGTTLTDRDYVEAAEVAIHQKDDLSAMTLASEAIRLNPKNGSAYYVRGRARFGGLAGDDQAPIDDLKKTIELSTSSLSTAGAWHCLARAYDAQNDFPHAIEAIDEAIKLRPKDQAAYKTRAALNTANNRKEDALRDYSMAIKLRANDAEVYFQRGQILETMKRFDEALKDYDGAAKHGTRGHQLPFKIMALKRQAEIYSQRSQFQKAAEVITTAMTVDSTDEELYRLRGEALEKLNKYEDAIADYSKAIEMSPDYSQRSYENRGRCYERLGRKELAAKDREESKRLLDKPAEKPLYDLKSGGR